MAKENNSNYHKELELVLRINVVCHSVRQGSTKEIGPVGDPY